MANKIKSNKYIQLKKLVKFSSKTWDQKSIFDDYFPYLEISDIDLITGDIPFIKSILVQEAPSRAKMIVENDNIVISTTRPTRGAISLLKGFNSSIIASTGFSVISKVDERLLNKNALYFLLRQDFTLKQFEQRSSGGNYPAITQEELGNIIIPLVDSRLQQEIVDIYNDAYKQKQAKEAEAKELLASIDDYLLAELGITLPEQDNSLQKRTFITNFSKLTGSRFDPKLYDSNTILGKLAILNSFYKCIRLQEIINYSCNGDWGIDEGSGNETNFRKCLVIRATEFDNSYNLNLDNSRVKYRLIKKDKLISMDIQAGDLLIEKSGGSLDQPVGRVAIIEEYLLNSNNLCYSNFIQKIRVNPALIYAEYLFCVLKTFHNIKLTDSMQSQTNGIRNLIMNNYFAQQIPLPPIEKQQEIAAHISQIRQKAKQLQEDGASILANAKVQVEQLILGN